MWQVYFADWLQDHKAQYPHDKLNVAQAAKEAGQLYKTLTEAEKEDLKRRVQLEKDARERRLSAWQRTLTPGDIKRENKFRAAQRKAGLSRRANIKDPNAPKKPLSAYFMFLAKIRSDPRLVDEVFGGETETTRQSVLAAQTWRDMSDEEKRPFLTQAEHDKIQYEALRKIYEEQAGSGNPSSNTSTIRRQMAGTGYIVPQQMGISDDITAAILSAKPTSGDLDEFRMVSYDPQATITARKSASKASAVPVFSTTGTIRRRVRKATRYSLNDSASRSHSRGGGHHSGADDSMDSAESDDEWVPGKSI
ncbi:exp1-like protein [Serendipita sp. 399]|nr:exp1-like protein [Serendipita sp. 399]